MMSHKPLIARVLLPALAAIISAAFFSGALAAPAQPKKLKILASTFSVYQITRNVVQGYPGAEVELMLPAALGCPHDYSLTPGDMRKIASADALVVVGLGFEEFLGAPVERAKAGMKIIDASAEIEVGLKEAEVEGRDHGHGRYNAHVFASPRFSAQMAETIARKLADMDPKGMRAYLENAKKYAERMMSLTVRLAGIGRRFPNNRVATSHDAFDYFLADAGVNVVASIDSHAGRDPSAGEMRALAARLKEQRAGALFYEAQNPSKTALVVAREAGVQAVALDPGVCGQEEAPLDWFDRLVERNLQVLEKTLGVR